jgi:hypothetical protein
MARLLQVCLLAALLAVAAQAQAAAGIYTCIDGKGRRLTSDRPILECADREQQELNASGTVRRTLPPSMTASERAAHEQAQQRLAEERQRQEEERRMERALLVRYPGPAVHASERAKALTAAQDVIAIAQDRIDDLAKERKALEAEAEFYKTPAQWPAKLKRQFEDNEQQAAAQRRQVAHQEDEKKRIDRRFDEELARLKVLWAKRQGTAAAVVAGPAQR